MYTSRITRQNPTAFIILIDQSGSMEEQITFNNECMTKADAVATATNMIISELLNRSYREEQIRDYIDIAVIGYCSDGAQSLLSPKGTFIKASQLVHKECPIKTITKERILPNGEHLMTSVVQRCWINPKAKGNTPMYAALLQAYELANQWCSKLSNQTSYPPTIFNITDGEATDADEQMLCQISNQIKNLSTKDGNVLMINIHISASESHTQVLFPNDKSMLVHGRYAHMLYDMSSEMPAQYIENILHIDGAPATPPFRGMSFNTSITELISMMNIGSMTINLM